jgi:hypothetical protein
MRRRREDLTENFKLEISDLKPVLKPTSSTLSVGGVGIVAAARRI